MRKLLILVCILPLFTASHCNNDDDQVNCTTEARAGLNITVKDAVTSAVITEEVTVVASEGAYEETLENTTGSGIFSGAWERSGTYVITISKPGYQTFTSGAVTVTEDVCHVIPQSRTFQITPQ